MSQQLLGVLQALGIAIANSFWQMGILWLLVLLYLKLRPTAKTGAVSLLSFFALLTGFISFLLTFFNALYQPQLFATASFLSVQPQLIPQFFLAVGSTYIILLVLPFIKIINGYRQINLLRNSRLKRVPGHIKLFTADGAAYLGIQKKVSIWISSLIQSPLTIGFFKPVILLPVAILTQLSTEQVEAVIMHELSHIKRNDYVVNFLSKIILAFLYFNPFAKALSNIQFIEREKAADNWVLQFDYNNSAYASALLAIAKNSKTNPALTIEASNPHSLLQRIKCIMGDTGRNMPGSKKITGAIATICLLFCLGNVNTKYLQNENVGANITQSNFAQTTATPFLPISNGNNENFKIEKIPVEINENAKPSKAILYLKEQKNNEGQIIVQPETDVTEDLSRPVVLFINNVTAHVQPLDAEKEKNIEAALETSKRIIAEQSWKELELALAETVTEKQKQILKQQFLQKIYTADWSNIENQMRLNYSNTDWEKINAKLAAVNNVFTLDSIYNNYKIALDQFHLIKKNLLLTDSLKTTMPVVAEIDNNMHTIQKRLHQMDSLRNKKVVEL